MCCSSQYDHGPASAGLFLCLYAVSVWSNSTAYPPSSNRDKLKFLVQPALSAPLQLNALNDNAQREARARLDGHVTETVAWHFHESTGCPFWLDFKRQLKFDPLKEVRSFDDLQKFPPFEDEWLRGGPVSRWVPKGLAGKPIYVFETGAAHQQGDRQCHGDPAPRHH